MKIGPTFFTPLQRTALVGSLLLTSGLAHMSMATAAETSSPPTAAAAVAKAAPEHVALRDAIWRLERLLRHRLVRPSQSGSRGLPGDVKPAELEELLGVLRTSADKRVAAEGGDLARKAAALTPLLHQLKAREGAADGTSLPASPWEPRSGATVVEAGAGATCAAAFDVIDGSYRATIDRRTDGTGGELWLRYAAKHAGMALVDTVGSDFDTVVDWFDACPTPGQAPLAHGDDETGLQARAAARVTAGESSWIRIRGWEDAKGSATIRLEGGAAGFTGIVTNESSGQPLVSRYVRVWSASGSFVTSDYTDSDGRYLVLGLSPGTYYASTSSYYWDGFLDELYDDSPCAGGAPAGCSPTTGTPIVVQDGVISGGIDFALGRGAAIAGRVRQAANGAGLPDVEVYVYGANGGLARWTETDEAGRYLVTGLASGTVFAVAGESYSEYRRELYQDIPCTPGCNATTGTPIAVTAGQTTAGVDFALERLGVVAGAVQREVDGAPVTYARVDILDAQGGTWAWGYTNAAGEYLAGGLNAGSYIARVSTFGAYRDELYDDVRCDYWYCNLAEGTPFTVALESTTSGIDFELQQWGKISGLLTDAQTGNPLAGYSYLNVYDAAGILRAFEIAYGGAYEVEGLAAETYTVRANHYAYRDELYDDVPCPENCDPTTGSPVTVALNATTTGIDFALTPLGKIAGSITEAGNSAPLDGVHVSVWNGAGEFVTVAYSHAGTYQAIGLPPGNYFVTAERWDFVGELFDDKLCPGGPPTGCNPTNGSSIAVSLAATTSGIDFALVRKGVIAGTVRDQATSAPVPYPTIWVYDSAGTYVRGWGGASDGTYQIEGLAAGTYFVIADSYRDYDAELYDGVPCPSASCNPTTGKPVAVTLGGIASGIDFALSSSGVITGLVTDPNGDPRSGIQVILYGSSGQYSDYVWTDAEGHYELSAEPGTWYVLASGNYDFGSQLYSGIPCNDGSCTVTSGTPVVVTAGNETPDIDFALSYERGIAGRVTDNGHPLAGVAIDLWNEAGEHVATTVTGPGGWYRFHAEMGTYFVSTDSGMGALEEIWDNVPCPLGPAYQGLCDPTTGTPIAVASYYDLVSGIDFALDNVQLFYNGFESSGHGWSAKWPP